MSEAAMTSPSNKKPLNDTLSVKRTIKHFDFSEPYWEGTKQKKLLIQYCKETSTAERKRGTHFIAPAAPARGFPA